MDLRKSTPSRKSGASRFKAKEYRIELSRGRREMCTAAARQFGGVAATLNNRLRKRSRDEEEKRMRPSYHDLKFLEK